MLHAPRRMRSYGDASSDGDGSAIAAVIRRGRYLVQKQYLENPA